MEASSGSFVLANGACFSPVSLCHKAQGFQACLLTILVKKVTWLNWSRFAAWSASTTICHPHIILWKVYLFGPFSFTSLYVSHNSQWIRLKEYSLSAGISPSLVLFMLACQWQCHFFESALKNNCSDSIILILESIITCSIFSTTFSSTTLEF